MTRRTISIVLSAAVLVSLYFFITSAIKINTAVLELNHRSTSAIAAKRIILIAQELDTPYWKLLQQGAAKQAEAYGYMLQYIGPQRHNIEEQRRLLEKAIASKPDAIITQGLDGQEALFELAQQQGISIITVDTDIGSSNRIAYIGTDNVLAGEQMAALMLAQLNTESAHIGVVIGSYAHNQSERLKAFQQALAKHPHIELVDIRVSNISKLQAAEMTIEMLNEHPDIDVFVGLSGLDAVGIVDGLNAIDKQKIAVFGFDNLLNTEALIQEGRIMGSIVQQPEWIGKQAIDVLHSYIEDQPYSEQTYISTIVLTAKQSSGGNDEN